MHILSIDRGSHNIGLAYSLGDQTVLPLGSIPNDPQTLWQISAYLHSKQIQRIVIGMPRDPQTQVAIKKFVAELKTLLESDQDIVEYNEDYSTIQAMAVFPNQSKNAQDTLSAMVILREYLASLDSHI